MALVGKLQRNAASELTREARGAVSVTAVSDVSSPDTTPAVGDTQLPITNWGCGPSAHGAVARRCQRPWSCTNGRIQKGPMVKSDIVTLDSAAHITHGATLAASLQTQNSRNLSPSPKENRQFALMKSTTASSLFARILPISHVAAAVTPQRKTWMAAATVTTEPMTTRLAHHLTKLLQTLLGWCLCCRSPPSPKRTRESRVKDWSLLVSFFALVVGVNAQPQRLSRF